MNDLVRVLDCNGREIKIGDRVKIIAEECNKFMRDCYGEDLPPEMVSTKDEYGTVAIADGFAQVVDENGEMLLDLNLYCDGEQESCIEVIDCNSE